MELSCILKAEIESMVIFAVCKYHSDSNERAQNEFRELYYKANSVLCKSDCTV